MPGRRAGRPLGRAAGRGDERGRRERQRAPGRLDEVTDLTVERLAGISDEQAAFGATWAGFRVTLAFRFGRWSSHIREHAIQIEKTFDMIGHVPDERARLVRQPAGGLRARRIGGLRPYRRRWRRRADRAGGRRGEGRRRVGPGRGGVASRPGRGAHAVLQAGRGSTRRTRSRGSGTWWAGAADRVAASIEAGDPGRWSPRSARTSTNSTRASPGSCRRAARPGTRWWSRRRATRRCDPSR